MSSTTNVQNLLVNVFRPSYQYRTVPSPNYYVQLEISNVETVYANVVDTQNLRVSDSNSNVYVGREAGNAYADLRDCFSNTTLGYGAGRALSNTDRGIYIGFNAGTNSSNASNVIAIGTNASGKGTKNIYIGNNTGGADGETRNTYIGNDLSSSGTTSNRLWIGDISGILISGDFSNRSVGILTSNPTTYPVEIANYTFISNGLGVNADPRAHTLNVNGDCRIEDGFGLFTFDQDQVTSNSTMTFWSYTSGKRGLVQFGQTALSNPVNFGINTPGVSGGYSLDVSGTVRIRDLSGSTVVVENNILGSDGGFRSIRGSTSNMANLATTTLGTWKKGINTIAAVATVAGTWVAGSWLYDGTTVTLISSNQATATITASGANIVLTNTNASSRTFTYNITYFPTP